MSKRNPAQARLPEEDRHKDEEAKPKAPRAILQLIKEATGAHTCRDVGGCLTTKVAEEQEPSCSEQLEDGCLYVCYAGRHVHDTRWRKTFWEMSHV